jgi:ADP-ribose pyrophosphatase
MEMPFVKGSGKVKKMNNKFEEKRVDGREYFRNSFMHVTNDEVILPDGLPSERVVVHHPGGVNLIALDEQNRLLLVEQFRYSIGRSTYETPAGKRELGEANLDTALRELQEETGYTAKRLISLGELSVSPGYTSEFIENFLALDLEKLDYEVKGDDDEFLCLHAVSKTEALELMKSGQICDYKTAYAIQYLMIHHQW